ncbi:MAG: hypothetical protein ACON5A_05015 [Candidatus Comchoanobacterales bacterium]
MRSVDFNSLKDQVCKSKDLSQLDPETRAEWWQAFKSKLDDYHLWDIDDELFDKQPCAIMLFFILCPETEIKHNPNMCDQYNLFFSVLSPYKGTVEYQNLGVDDSHWHPLNQYAVDDDFHHLFQMWLSDLLHNEDVFNFWVKCFLLSKGIINNQIGDDSPDSRSILDMFKMWFSVSSETHTLLLQPPKHLMGRFLTAALKSDLFSEGSETFKIASETIRLYADKIRGLNINAVEADCASVVQDDMNNLRSKFLSSYEIQSSMDWHSWCISQTEKRGNVFEIIKNSEELTEIIDHFSNQVKKIDFYSHIFKHERENAEQIPSVLYQFLQNFQTSSEECIECIDDSNLSINTKKFLKLLMSLSGERKPIDDDDQQFWSTYCDSSDDIRQYSDKLLDDAKEELNLKSLKVLSELLLIKNYQPNNELTQIDAYSCLNFIKSAAETNIDNPLSLVEDWLQWLKTFLHRKRSISTYELAAASFRDNPDIVFPMMKALMKRIVLLHQDAWTQEQVQELNTMVEDLNQQASFKHTKPLLITIINKMTEYAESECFNQEKKLDKNCKDLDIFIWIFAGSQESKCYPLLYAHSYEHHQNVNIKKIMDSPQLKLLHFEPLSDGNQQKLAAKTVHTAVTQRAITALNLLQSQVLKPDKTSEAIFEKGDSVIMAPLHYSLNVAHHMKLNKVKEKLDQLNVVLCQEDRKKIQKITASENLKKQFIQALNDIKNQLTFIQAEDKEYHPWVDALYDINDLISDTKEDNNHQQMADIRDQLLDVLIRTTSLLQLTQTSYGDAQNNSGIFLYQECNDDYLTLLKSPSLLSFYSQKITWKQNQIAEIQTRIKEIMKNTIQGIGAFYKQYIIKGSNQFRSPRHCYDDHDLFWFEQINPNYEWFEVYQTMVRQYHQHLNYIEQFFMGSVETLFPDLYYHEVVEDVTVLRERLNKLNEQSKSASTLNLFFDSLFGTINSFTSFPSFIDLYLRKVFVNAMYNLTALIKQLHQQPRLVEELKETIIQQFSTQKIRKKPALDEDESQHTDTKETPDIAFVKIPMIHELGNGFFDHLQSIGVDHGSVKKVIQRSSKRLDSGTAQAIPIKIRDMLSLTLK